MRFFLGSVLTILVGLNATAPLGAATETDQVRDKLVQLQEDDLWGEAMLAGGQIRSIKVDSLSSDSVAVSEVLGALQRRAAVYALADIHSLRELGVHRIPLRRAPYRASKSMIASLGLEILVPGGGVLISGRIPSGTRPAGGLKCGRGNRACHQKGWNRWLGANRHLGQNRFVAAPRG